MNWILNTDRASRPQEDCEAFVITEYTEDCGNYHKGDVLVHIDSYNAADDEWYSNDGEVSRVVMYQPVITPPLPENLEQYVSKDFTGNVYEVTTRDDEGRADTNLPMIALDDLPFAALTKTSLRNGRLTTLRSIAAQTPEELYCLRGIGEKSYLAIVALLKEHGVDDQPYLDYMKSRHKNQG